MSLSINKIIKELERFVEQNGMLNDFGYGETSDIGTDRKMEMPYLWVTHRNSSFFTVQNGGIYPSVNFSFIIVDQVNDMKSTDQAGFGSDNRKDIMSDTYDIQGDLLIFLIKEITEKYRVEINDPQVNLEVVMDETDDAVYGWLMDITINLGVRKCIYPKL